MSQSLVTACESPVVSAPPTAVLDAVSDHHARVLRHIQVLRRCDLHARIATFVLLRRQWLAHVELEEARLFPGLLMHDNTRSHTERLQEQHAEIAQRLDELCATNFSELVWFRLFDELAELMEAHIREDVLDALRDTLFDRSAAANTQRNCEVSS